jgi:cytoskeleton protein RodZ
MTKVTRLTLNEDGSLNRRRIHLREISGDLDAPLETVGQDLRAARLRRGDDLATVSRALKIRKDHLEALEEDRMEALPGRTYAVGFVRSYADYLGLDVVQCVERFKAEIAGRNEEAPQQINVMPEDEQRRLPQGWKIIAAVILVVVLYGAYLLWQQADRMLSEQQVAPPPQLVTKPPKAAESAAAVTPPPAASLQTSPPAAEVQITNPPAASLQTPSAPPAESQQSGLLPSGIAVPSASAPAQAQPLPQGVTYGGQNKNFRVLLRLHAAARVLVQGPDGKIFMNRTLKPGDTYQVPNLVGLTLTTSDAGAVEVDLDGQALGLVGKSQETAEAVSLDPQSIVDRYNGGQ